MYIYTNIAGVFMNVRAPIKQPSVKQLMRSPFAGSETTFKDAE